MNLYKDSFFCVIREQFYTFNLHTHQYPNITIYSCLILIVLFHIKETTDTDREYVSRSRFLNQNTKYIWNHYCKNKDGNPYWHPTKLYLLFYQINTHVCRIFRHRVFDLSMNVPHSRWNRQRAKFSLLFLPRF